MPVTLRKTRKQKSTHPLRMLQEAPLQRGPTSRAHREGEKRDSSDHSFGGHLGSLHPQLPFPDTTRRQMASPPNTNFPPFIVPSFVPIHCNTHTHAHHGTGSSFRCMGMDGGGCKFLLRSQGLLCRSTDMTETDSFANLASPDTNASN